MSKRINIAIAVVLLLAPAVTLAAWQSSGPIPSLSIYSDNGVTHFSGFTTTGNCAYNRLELRETGDYFGNVENGRRIFALVLAAQLEGRLVSLGYNDTDGPGCRVSSVTVQW
jgi:hypothetical protein